MNLVIELTRKCNLQCCHCLRGCAENKTISDEILNATFKTLKNTYISGICLSGGEPSLVPDRIFKIIELAKKHNVEFGSFYIATNAKVISDEFLKAMLELYLYCDEKSECRLAISNDLYHEYEWEENIEKLKAFTFTRKKEQQDNNEYNKLINDGYASVNYSECNLREESLYTIEYDECNKFIDSIIYINCKGNILPSCDLSYESQDLPLLIIGNVNNNDNWFRGIDSYNKRLTNSKCKTVQDVKNYSYKLA